MERNRKYILSQVTGFLLQDGQFLMILEILITCTLLSDFILTAGIDVFIDVLFVSVSNFSSETDAIENSVCAVIENTGFGLSDFMEDTSCSSSISNSSIRSMITGPMLLWIIDFFFIYDNK
jgi:hypothetical protein